MDGNARDILNKEASARIRAISLKKYTVVMRVEKCDEVPFDSRKM
jgi:hypothetical protein